MDDAITISNDNKFAKKYYYSIRVIMEIINSFNTIL